MNKKKTNLFILGAPKCGTTSLYTYLKDHPQIFMSPIKEPNYFNTDRNARRIKEKDKYEMLFSSASHSAEYLGEGSTWYLYSKTAVPNIMDYNPNSKFIVMLRNPLEMAPSLHKQLQMDLRETESNFRKAWDLQYRRRKGDEIPKRCREKYMLLYGPVCKLGEQLERLYKKCKKENILIIFLDELKNNPAKVLSGIEKYLGIEEWLPNSFPVVNPATKRISTTFQSFLFDVPKIKKKLGLNFSFGIGRKLDKMNMKNDRYSIDQNMKKELLEYFYEDINKIEDLMDVNLDHWKEI